MLPLVTSAAGKDSAWVYLLGAVLGSGGAVKLLSMLSAWLSRRQLRGESAEVQRNHVGVMEQGWILEDLIDHTRAGRAVLLFTHNGDGKVRHGSPVYSSVFDERSQDGIPRIRARWQGQLLDGEYRSLIGRLSGPEPYLLLVADKMAPSDLRDLYHADGVTFSKVVRLGFTPKRMYYLSINFFQGAEAPATPQERDTIRSCVRRLQLMFAASEPGWIAGFNPAGTDPADY